MPLDLPAPLALRSAARPRRRAAAVAALLCLAWIPAQAQTTYRWIDRDGRVVVSDTPPPANARSVESRAAATGSAPLPLDVQLASRNFPVVLYTAADCGQPCDDARALLAGRRVPFSEKAVRSDEDFRALKAATGDSFVPTLTVGKEVLKGLAPPDWNNLLDLAGYPRPAP